MVVFVFDISIDADYIRGELLIVKQNFLKLAFKSIYQNLSKLQIPGGKINARFTKILVYAFQIMKHFRLYVYSCLEFPLVIILQELLRNLN